MSAAVGEEVAVVEEGMVPLGAVPLTEATDRL